MRILIFGAGVIGSLYVQFYRWLEQECRKSV